MADRWRIVTDDGVLDLNASFTAEQYELGGVDANTLNRRDGRSGLTRVGDGYRTPAPFRLRGRVWSDDQVLASVRAEVNAINQACRGVRSIERVTSAGVTSYSGITRAAEVEVKQEGPALVSVGILVWPSTATTTFTPVDPGGPVEALRAAVTFETFNAGTVTRDIVVPGGADPNDLVIVTMWCQNAATIDSAPAGTVTLGAAALQPIATVPPPDGFAATRLWAFAIPGSSVPTVASFQTTAFYGVITATVLAGANLSTADVAAVLRVDQGAGTPQEIAGTATVGGAQLVIGGLTVAGGGF